MGLYLVALSAIVVLALALLAAVALAAAARRGNDQTRFSQRLQSTLDHLNGDAEAPQFWLEMFAGTQPAAVETRPAPPAPSPRPRKAVAGSSPAAAVVSEPRAA